MKALLADNEVLLEYFVAEKKTIAFIIRKNGLAYEEIPIGRSGLRELMTSVGKIFGRLSDSRTRDAKWADIRADRLHQLYESIFKPVEKHLAAQDALIIVPDDVLSFLPFEMLVTDIADYKPAYLIQRYPISYAYSASLLNPTLKRTGRTAELDLLAIGNPDFSTLTDPSNPQPNAMPTEVLVPLPCAEAEVDRISKVVRRKQVFVRASATEKAFKEWAGRVKVLHIATHNIIDDVNPLYSKIVFTLDPKRLSGEDGLLHMYEIFDMKLNADLAVLSGCETGLGKLRRGEGLEGMSRAFLYAGVPSLIASLWQVVDGQPTPEFFSRFYKYLAKGMDKRQALRKAKLEMIANDRYEDPFYWAPFILIGDTGPISLDRAYPAWLAVVTLVLVLGTAASIYSVHRAHRRSRASR